MRNPWQAASRTAWMAGPLPVNARLVGTLVLILGFGVADPLQAQPDSGPGAWLSADSPFWTWDADRFAKEGAASGFRWVTPGEQARAAPLKGEVYGQEVMEALVRFDAGKPAALRLVFFNRGDAKVPLSTDAYRALVDELVRSLDQWTGVPSRAGPSTSRQTSVRDAVLLWQLPSRRFELVHSYSYVRPDPSKPAAFQAEFVRITVTPQTAQDLVGVARLHVHPTDVKARVFRDASSGDVYLKGIPMVDQGPKGYCAAATSERVLQFFGETVDQHQVAQLAGTSSQGGTSPGQLEAALRAVGRQYGFSLRTLQSYEWNDFEREFKAYNQVARRAGKPRLSYSVSAGVDIAGLYRRMDRDLFVQSQTARRADLQRFEGWVSRFVDGGVPLAWAVVTGLVPETPGVRSVGGHLRLIIGYNPGTREILYSDSWGRGHEFKRLSLESAFAITTGVYALEPRGIRL
jgi:hypothetical protein